MPLLSKPSAAARTALIYITLGALILVWTGVVYVYLRNNDSPENPVRPGVWYICYGFFLTGGVLLVIGLALGRIGRAARHAELPPPEVTGVEAKNEQLAAARAPIMAPVNPAAPVVQNRPVNGPAVAPNAPAAVPVQAPAAAPVPPAVSNPPTNSPRRQVK
jgi:hypothetical protein